MGYYCGGMYNDCAVEMEPEYVGNHEDLKVQAPWGHLQTKSFFAITNCYFLTEDSLTYGSCIVKLSSLFC